MPAHDRTVREVAPTTEALADAADLPTRHEADRPQLVADEVQIELADRVAARSKTFLEAAPDAMLVVDREGAIKFANLRVESLLGFSPADLAGRPISWLLPERYLAAHDQHVVTFFRNPAPRPMGLGRALFARRKDGSEVAIDVSLSPFEMDGNACVMAALRDMTMHRQLEAKLEASRMQLLAATRLAALGSMAGGIAHEINTPLAVIHALASDLIEDADRHEVSHQSVRDAAGRIREFSERISRIISSMRHLSRDGTQDPLVPTAVDQIVRHAIDVCAERFRNSGIRLTVDPIDPSAMIPCRAGQISQVLVNLLQNAFDAVVDGDGEPWVRLLTELKEDAVQISVIDSGEGIESVLKQRIMEPFFTTKPPGKGTGLGLSTSHRIILDHGGSFVVTERDGHTCFSIDLARTPHG